MNLILLYLSKIAIIKILPINCAILIEDGSNDINRKRSGECNFKTQTIKLPPKKRKICAYDNEFSRCDHKEHKDSISTQQQDMQRITQQEQSIDKIYHLRILHCKNAAHAIIILAYLNNLQHEQALKSRYNKHYEQSANTMRFNQAAYDVLIKQFTQTQWVLETIRDKKDTTTFTAINEAQDEFKTNILQALENNKFKPNLIDIQVDEYENQEKINNDDIRTGFEIISDNLSENSKKSNINYKDILDVKHKDIITKLLKVKAKIMQIKEEIIALKAFEDKVAEIHMENESCKPAIEDSIIEKVEEILIAMYALYNERTKQINKVEPAKQIVKNLSNKHLPGYAKTRPINPSKKSEDVLENASPVNSKNNYIQSLRIQEVKHTQDKKDLQETEKHKRSDIQNQLSEKNLVFNLGIIYTQSSAPSNRNEKKMLSQLSTNTDSIVIPGILPKRNYLPHSEYNQVTTDFKVSNFQTESLFMHYLENLEITHKILETDQKQNQHNFKCTFKAITTKHILKLKSLCNIIDDDQIKMDIIDLENYKNNYGKVLSYKYYIQPDACDDIIEFCKKDVLFYSMLNKFVDTKFLYADFTFNNLYALICYKVQKVILNANETINVERFKENILNMLIKSSNSTKLYFYEIPRLIDYIKNRRLVTLANHINDVSVYFAILNVFSVVIRKNWSSMIYNGEASILRNITNEDINRIVENEKHRQFFYKVLLYVIRPFVSVKRYQEVWCRIICQDLVVMHLQEYGKDENIAENCYAKLVCFQLYELFAFENDYCNNVLINRVDNDLSIENAVKSMINHNNFVMLNTKIGQKMFLQRLQLIINCIITKINAQHNLENMETKIKISYLKYLEQIKKSLYNFKHVTFAVETDWKNPKYTNNNLLVVNQGCEEYQKKAYLDGLYLLLHIRY
ncbi:hypothetical protein COBT_000377 [Conglomerata obtusa]